MTDVTIQPCCTQKRVVSCKNKGRELEVTASVINVQYDWQVILMFHAFARYVI